MGAGRETLSRVLAVLRCGRRRCTSPHSALRLLLSLCSGRRGNQAMPREIITVQARHALLAQPFGALDARSQLPILTVFRLQVGQCGNQVGCRFWELALREHAAHNSGGRFDEALSSFFQNVDARTTPPTPLPVGDGRGHIRTLKARAATASHSSLVVDGR